MSPLPTASYEQRLQAWLVKRFGEWEKPCDAFSAALGFLIVLVLL